MVRATTGLLGAEETRQGTPAPPDSLAVRLALPRPLRFDPSGGAKKYPGNPPPPKKRAETVENIVEWDTWTS